jgi:uncharacterized membrane protein (UPF0127 family)
MKKILLILAVFGLVIVGGCGTVSQTNESSTQNMTGTEKTGGPTVSFETDKGKTVVNVEIADTSAERTKGLMYRKSLAEYNGMFFIFETEQPLNFWMKNTLIPLDMIFLDANYGVVKVQKNVQPCKIDPCAVFLSGKPAKYVLEVNSGTSDRMGLKAGDKALVTI